MMRFNIQPPRLRVVSALGVLSAYGLVFFLLYPQFHEGVAALAVLPVAVLAWLGGSWVGLLAGLLSIPLNTLLLNLGQPRTNPWMILINSGGGPGSLAIVLIGVIVGRLHDLHAQVSQQREQTAQQLIQQQKAEAALSESEQRYRALFEAAQRQTQELTLLDQVRDVLARELEVPVVLQTVVEGIAKTFGYTQVSLYLLESEVLVLQHQVGYEHALERIAVTEGVSGRVVRTGQPVFLEDVRSDPNFLGAIEGITSEVCIPLIDQDRVVGILNVESIAGVQLTQADLRLMLALGQQVGIALGRARLYADLRDANETLTRWLAEMEQHNRQMILLNQMNAGLQACHTPQEAYKLVPPLLQQLFPEEAGALYRLNASRTLMERVASWRLEPSGDRVWGPDACGALQHGYLYVVDVTPGVAFSQPADPALFCGHVESPYPSASLCAPLLAQEGVLGLLHVRSLGSDLSARPLTPQAPPQHFNPAKQQLAQTVADILALALSNLHLQETLREQAIRDEVTGLFNRRYLEETLEREVKRLTRGLRPLGLIMLDLDHFKRFNDTYGHLAGDALLKALGTLLQSRVRGGDIACRYGGEEFVLVLPEAPFDVTRSRAEQLREEIKQLVTSYNGETLGPITVSLGVAAFPEHGRTREAVIRAADQALYRAKAEGRDRVVVADPQG